MYTFRFNPVFQQWAVLGQATASHPLKPEHFLDIGQNELFTAAAYPRQSFLLEPPERKVFPKKESELLFADQPALGEYELLLYKGDQDPFFWEAKVWEAWLDLVQQRIRLIHENPYLNYLKFSFASSAIQTVPKYMRVGDLIATSHPISGNTPVLEHDLANKLKKKESIFTVLDNPSGSLYVPSAPLYAKEVWYVPAHYQSGIEQITKSGRQDLAQILAVLLRRLHLHYPQDNFVLNIYSALAKPEEESTWWLQIHQEDKESSILNVRPLPEAFVHTLLALLKPGSSH